MTATDQLVSVFLTADEIGFVQRVARERGHGVGEAVASIVRDRMFRDTVYCESCGKRIDREEADGWGGEDCDLCPQCMAALAKEGQP
jgi:predicted amidophosphoribosyltransferase